MSTHINNDKLICIVAILCDENRFLDEWLVYHRMIGIEHFFLYDDDPAQNLEMFLSAHNTYVTVIPWYKSNDTYEGRNRQTKAYTHALLNYCTAFKWVTFLDADEFIVLKKWDNISIFLEQYNDYGAISLNWHVFGHNGYFDDPPDLITSSLTRRKLEPSKNVKTISRTLAIKRIPSAHFCRYHQGWKRVDANKKPYLLELYPGKTDIAHINHYQCRSFVTWMARVKRGDVNIDRIKGITQELWRVNEDECLKQFITTISKDKNEFQDTYMLRFKNEILSKIKEVKGNFGV